MFRNFPEYFGKTILYKYRLTHYLLPSEQESRMTFCRIVNAQNANPDFLLGVVLWSTNKGRNHHY